MKKLLIMVLLMNTLAVSAGGLSTDKLPLFSETENIITKDWLVNSIQKEPALFRTDEGFLVFSNGIISRTFTLSPACSTLSMKHLQTGHEFLRSVRPEGELVLNGIRLSIGGLDGIPVHNFFCVKWLKNMRPVTPAFELTGYKIQDIKERFQWKKHPGWMAEDRIWPPKGKELIFTYKLPASLLKKGSILYSDNSTQETVFSDDFTELKKCWKLSISSSDPRNSFINEGKPGEIMSLADSTVFAEKTIEKDTETILLHLDTGTDVSHIRGPGMSIVFSDGSVLKFNTSIRGNKLGFYYKNKKTYRGKLKKSKPFWLKVVLKRKLKTAEAYYSNDGKKWDFIDKTTYTGQPESVRIGKTGINGGNRDAGNPGPRIRCHMLSYSEQKPVPRKPSDISFLGKLTVKVHYALYTGAPIISKWITVENGSSVPVRVDKFKSEILAFAEPRNEPSYLGEWMLPNITVQSDYDCGGGMQYENGEGKAYFWKKDPLYTSQINWDRKNPCLFVAEPVYGPAYTLSPEKEFSTYRIWEELHSTRERERRGLEQRRMFALLAPWITQNPIMMHLRSSSTRSVKAAIDQCAEVGFDMLILSFGSGFNIENDSDAYIARMKRLADYANSKGIAIGGYSLLASRRVIRGSNVVSPPGMRPRFRNSPCVCSKWGETYFHKLYNFYKKTGFTAFEHDGSYPGDVCRSTTHPGHKGLSDSRWNQFIVVRDFYRWCCENGIYLNVPDWYILNGSDKVGMGYREVNWSLPRAQQEIIERQNIYDATWFKPVTLGWMHVPLVQYHGGGKAACYEPLHKHLKSYEQRLANLFGAGVQAVWRGVRLYDTEETKKLVKKWVSFYKKYKKILCGDIIHVRRPDGRDYDAILHVNPRADIKGLLMVYNPLEKKITRKITLNLYYTGLKDNAVISEKDKNPAAVRLGRDYTVTLDVTVPAHSQTWFTIQEAK